MATAKTSEIKWLHLSDFHLRPNIAWSQDVVLKSLLEDIGQRYRADSPVGSPHLLFLTGDIAFSGKSEEYKLAEAFVHELMRVTNVTPERLCIIPGNHDIDRSIEEDAFKGVQGILSNENEVDKFLASESRRRTLFRRQPPVPI